MNGKVWSCETEGVYTLDNQSSTTSITIMDSSDGATGSINKSGYSMVINNLGSVTFTSGTLGLIEKTETPSFTPIVNNTGTFVLDGGSIIVESAMPTTHYIDAILNTGTLEMNSGVISVVSGAYVRAIQNRGTVSITGGQIIAESTSSQDTYGILSQTGNVNITGGSMTVKSETSKNVTGIITLANFNMTGGTIIAEAKVAETVYAINGVDGTVTIEGGTISVVGENGDNVYGIYNESSTLTIGKIGEGVSTESPAIISSSIGVFSADAADALNFYDGIIRGKVASIQSNNINVEEGYSLFGKIEEYESEIYHTAYLSNVDAVARIEQFYFDSIQAAVDYSKNYVSIEDAVAEVVVILKDVEESVTIADESIKNIVFDLNGYTWSATTSYTLNNKSVLTHVTIRDSSDGQTGIMKNDVYGSVICIGGSITIESGTISANAEEKVASGIAVMKVNKDHLATITINGGKIDVSSNAGAAGIRGVGYASVIFYVNMNGGEISAFSTNGVAHGITGNVFVKMSSGIINVKGFAKSIGLMIFSGTAEVTGGTINVGPSGNVYEVKEQVANPSSYDVASSYGILNNGSGTITVSNATINVEGISISITDSTLDLTSVTISNIGTAYGIYSYLGEVIMTSGTINVIGKDVEIARSKISLNNLSNIGTVYGIYNYGWKNTTVTSGTINVQKGNINIEDENLEWVEKDTNIINVGTAYGVYSFEPVNIGSKDNVMSIENPIIISDDYGIYIGDTTNTALKVNFYDGIIKGKTNAFGNISNMDFLLTIASTESGYGVKTEIEGEYEVAYLMNAVAQVGNLYYSSIQNAINANTGTITIKVLKNVDECVVVSKKINATINLNGMQWSCTKEASYTLNIDHLEAVITIKDSTSQKLGVIKNDVYGNVIYNNGKFILESGTISVTSNLNQSHFAIINKRLLGINGGTINVSSSSNKEVGGISDSNNTTISGGTINVSGGMERYTFGVYGVNSTSSLRINGGSITSTGIAVKTEGSLSYYGGELIGTAQNSSIHYSYFANEVNRNGKSEYTSIETINGDMYFKTQIVSKVAEIGDVKYDTIGAAINAANDGDTITLLKNITETQMTLDLTGKSITIDLNGQILNNYIKDQGESIEITDYDFINVTGGSLVVKGASGNLTGLRRTVDLVNVNSGATLSVEGGTLSSTDGYAVVNENGATFNFNGGTLKGKENVFRSANIDLYIKDEYYITYNDAHTSASLTAGNKLNPELNVEAGLSGSNLVVKIENSNVTLSESNIVSLYLRSSGDNYEEELTCSEDDGLISCSITASSVAYLYNLKYDKELVIKYSQTNIIEIDRVDLLISGKVSENTIIESGNNQIITDGEIIVINKFDDGEIVLTDIIDVLFGAHKTAFIQGNLEIELQDYDSSACTTDGYTQTCKVEFAVSVSISEGYPTPNTSIIDGIIYNFTPKLVTDSGDVVENLGVIASESCALGSECNISSLSFKDYTGENASAVETVITLNGVAVYSIDTSEIGKYVVTSVGIDRFGNRSEVYVREYHVIDDVAPVVTLYDVVVIKKGHTYSDRDVVAVDNYYDDVTIERIDDEVDFSKAGTYRIGYRVTDGSGNETIVYRTVIIEEDSSVWFIISLLSAIVCALMFVLKRRKRKLC